MPPRKTRLSPDLAAARKKLEAWRSSFEGRRRVPREFWDLAVPLSRIHGVSRTSTVLGLSYRTLEKRLGATEPSSNAKAAERKSESFTFVEVSPRERPHAETGDCVLEIENRRGVKLTLWPGGDRFGHRVHPRAHRPPRRVESTRSLKASL